jgi:glycosyltransferase involved in cell wall biosynthesis
MTNGKQHPEIAIVGRCDFGVGIGIITEAFGELLARQMPICVLPTEPELRSRDEVVFPSGRRIPVCRDPSSIKVSFFVDVLWNGEYDHNFDLVPRNSFKYATVLWDSDRMPDRWTELVNSELDAAIVPSLHLIDVLRNCGVEKPIVYLPLALDLEPMLATPFSSSPKGIVRFGSVAAFHPRKGQRLLLECFAEEFGDRRDVELTLHSNLAFGDHAQELQRTITDLRLGNVKLSHGSLSRTEKNRLLGGFDVYVSASRGEGYSIGPREAMALGKMAVITDVGGHKELSGVPGLIKVAADIAVPGRFPEIDNLVFGHQHQARPEALRRGLRWWRRAATTNRWRPAAHWPPSSAFPTWPAPTDRSSIREPRSTRGTTGIRRRYRRSGPRSKIASARGFQS